jgi:cytosine deaminase
MDLVVRNARLTTGALTDIGIDGGRIVAVQPGLAAEAAVYDAGGSLTCAGLVETHIHLDKSRIVDRCAPEPGRVPKSMERVSAV